MGRQIVLCNYWSKLKHASESWKQREGKKNCMNLNKTLVEDSYRNIGYCNAFNYIYIYKVCEAYKQKIRKQDMSFEELKS
jgi:hypothetical protein